MMKFTKRNSIRLFLLAVMAFLLVACARSGPVTKLEGDLGDTQRVLVLPFQDMAWLHGINADVRSPITGKIFFTGPVADEADRFLTDRLISEIRRQTSFEIVASRDAKSLMERLTREHQWHRRQVLAETGRLLGADATIAGYVYRFRERQGSNYSAESPASVAFDIYLIDCRANRLVWSASYDETQQALSDNLGTFGDFMRRGGRWVSAEELAGEAMENMFEELAQQ